MQRCEWCGTWKRKGELVIAPDPRMGGATDMVVCAKSKRARCLRRHVKKQTMVRVVCRNDGIFGTT